MVTALGRTLTTQIGDVASANGVNSGDVIKVLAHAGVQCAEAQLTNRDCASAAIGGATAEILVPITNRFGTGDGPRDTLDPSTQRLGELVASLGAVMAAVATNRDAAIASAAAQQVDADNRQLHPQERSLIDRLATERAQRDCRGDAGCEANARVAWTDAMTRVAQGSVDDRAAIENRGYMQTLVNASAEPNSEGARGGLENYAARRVAAREMLQPYAGS